MKVNIDWLDKEYIGKTIEIEPMYFNKIDCISAINVLFHQEHGGMKNDIIFFDRNDIKHIPKTASSSMSLCAFASKNFNFYVVDKENIEEILNNEC